MKSENAREKPYHLNRQLANLIVSPRSPHVMTIVAYDTSSRAGPGPLLPRAIASSPGETRHCPTIQWWMEGAIQRSASGIHILYVFPISWAASWSYLQFPNPLVGGLEHFLIYWEKSSQLTSIVQRGRLKPPTRSNSTWCSSRFTSRRWWTSSSESPKRLLETCRWRWSTMVRWSDVIGMGHGNGLWTEVMTCGWHIRWGWGFYKSMEVFPWCNCSGNVTVVLVYSKYIHFLMMMMMMMMTMTTTTTTTTTMTATRIWGFLLHDGGPNCKPHIQRKKLKSRGEDQLDQGCSNPL